MGSVTHAHTHTDVARWSSAVAHELNLKSSGSFKNDPLVWFLASIMMWEDVHFSCIVCAVGRRSLCVLGGSGVHFSPLTERQELTSSVTYQHIAGPHSGDRSWNSSWAEMCLAGTSCHMRLPINCWPKAVCHLLQAGALFRGRRDRQMKLNHGVHVLWNRVRFVLWLGQGGK